MRGAAGDLRVLDMVRLPSDVKQAESRLHRSYHVPPVEVKVYPHQLDAMKLLLEGGRPAPLTSRTGRLNSYAPPNIQNLRPVLTEEQQAMRDAIWAAMRKSLGLETPENRDETDTG